MVAFIYHRIELPQFDPQRRNPSSLVVSSAAAAASGKGSTLSLYLSPPLILESNTKSNPPKLSPIDPILSRSPPRCSKSLLPRSTDLSYLSSSTGYRDRRGVSAEIVWFLLPAMLKPLANVGKESGIVMAGGRVEVVSSKGCSRLFVGTSLSSFCNLRSTEMMSSASSSSALLEPTLPQAGGPFAGLVICVTGLSKEARSQVMAATERLGGQYSATLHPKCTHLVVQSFGGRKYEHALKHGPRSGLLVVTLGWFVDSVRRNVRLSESLYSIKSTGENGLPLGEFNRLVGIHANENSCLPAVTFEDGKCSDLSRQNQLQSSRGDNKKDGFFFSNDILYIDSDISGTMRKKIVDAVSREGANVLDHWFIGCHASYVVCEGPSIQRYIGHTSNLVTPLWILKTIKEKFLQRLVHLSSDLARQVAMILEDAQISKENAKDGTFSPVGLNSKRSPSVYGKNKEPLEERQKFIDLAKLGVRGRRCRRMQSCQIPISPISPASLLNSICWSISEPTSSACIYTDSSWSEDASEQQTPFHDARDGKDSEPSFENFSRPLRESEKRELIFKNHFLTILFPIDRFGELGPYSKTFFSNGGFTCIQVLDHIYSFYQENMTANEIEVAIHTDSRHADRLRALYATTETMEQGFVSFKRIDFLGSRRSFETLKRLNVETNCSIYELLVRA